MSEFKLTPGLGRVLPESGFSERAREMLREMHRGGESPSSVAGTSQSFLETLQTQLGEANETLRAADKSAQDFALGRGGDLHDVMIAMEKADVALRTVTAVRNKVVEAYQEIMKMPV